jgi:hypothetical protein
MYFISLLSMIRRINRHKKIISSIFLLGYFSFIILTITHVHGNTFNSNCRTVEVINKISYSTACDSQENCQICHSFSSINVNNIKTAFSSGLLIETCVLINNDSNYKSNPVDINYLRGPPTFNILSI